MRATSKFVLVIPLLVTLAACSTRPAGQTNTEIQPTASLIIENSTQTNTAAPTPTEESPAPTLLPSPTTATLGGGTAILFSSDRGGDYQDLYLLDFATGLVTRLTQGDANTFPGPFSPDSKQILFTGFGLTNSYVGLMNADGSDPVDLTHPSDWDDGFPAWSPDGSQIAFTTNRDGNNEIYRMDPQGGNLQRLTDAPKDDFAPAWSPDGSQIAFLSDRDNPTGVYSIYLMKADGSGVQRLTDDQGNDYTPAWSLDGSQIAFRSVQDGQSDIYVVTLADKTITDLTNDPAEDWSPAWSPDGSLIAFQSNRDGNWEIYTMKADGSDPTNLTNDPADDQMPYWRK
jgi:Tol biopolymer transport system component